MVGVVGAALALSACSGNNDNNAKAGPGEACAVDKDCQDGLSCRAQACVDLTPADMGGDMDTDMGGDNNVTPMPEEFMVTYKRLDDFGDQVRHLWVLNSRTGEKVQISTDEPQCRLDCWVSSDLKTFAWVELSNTAQRYDVKMVGLNADFSFAGTPEVLASEVKQFRPYEQGVVYTKVNASSEEEAFAQPYAGGDAVLIGAITLPTTSPGGWSYSTEANKAVLLRPTLQDLSIFIGDTGQTLSEPLALKLGGKNYQETGGSYFSGNIPVAFSADGKYMALISTAPNDYNVCETTADCDTDRGQHCGREKRCTVREQTVHIFDMSALDKLGGGCTTDAACGSVHTCDIPSATSIDKAKCIPRRVVLGLPNTPAQPFADAPSKPGCELTNSRTSGGDIYTALAPRMDFDSSGALYVVGRREGCEQLDGANMPRADILKISPTTGAFSVLYGNGGRDYDAAKCYNAAENSIDVTNCDASIKSVEVSPNGNELIFLATSPYVNDPIKADVTMDVWSVLRDGTQQRWHGGKDSNGDENGIFDIINTLRVFPTP